MRKLMVSSILFVFVVCGGRVCCSERSDFEYDGRHGWPQQKCAPKLIVCQQGKTTAEEMLIESLSGLAAQAVNEGRFDEMVWIDVDNVSYKKIYTSSVRALKIEKISRMDVWQLLDHLREKRVVKGYILYKLTSGSDKPITDNSSNVATVYSALMSGVLIDESLTGEAALHGLKRLKDARQESLEECFKRNKNRLNNCSALSIHPSVVNMRDYAIAHKLMLYSDSKALIEKVLEWVTPLSPILGWGCGDEYDFTSLISEWGHYNTASNWCWNLPFISSARSVVEIKKAKELEMSDIAFDREASAHSFVMSDGDNMQWTMGNFIDNNIYMGNKDVNNVGLSWTLCPTNLSIISPISWNSLVDMQTDKMSYIEYGGGYQYPDLFASKRANRTELLTIFAKRINYHLKQLNIKIFGFICRDVSSEASQEAFRIYAQELEGVTGMMAVQYFPYELGGKIYWHKSREGLDIPVVTASYSLWNEINSARPNCGTPEYIASLINRKYLTSKTKNDSELSWTIVHAWSDFSKSSNMTPKPTIGVNAVRAAEKLLNNQIQTISANELLWRIRMKYSETKLHTL